MSLRNTAQHAPYRDVPLNSDKQGDGLDREAIASKSKDITRIDLESSFNASPSKNERQAEAILQQTFSSSTTSSQMSSRCKRYSTNLGVVGLLLLIMATQSVESVPAVLVLTLCLTSLGYATNLTISLLEKDTGTLKMRRVAGYIQEGAQGFFRTQFKAIISMAIVCCGMLFVGFLFRPPSSDVNVSPFVLAVITCIAFVCGAGCSCLAGFVGLWVSVRTNVRVASAARRSYVEAIQTAMQGGMIASLIVVGLAVLGLLVLYLCFEEFFVGYAEVATHSNEVPLLLVGYGFGASFVALFAQLGGGIYTKAADVGADLVGKVEAGIPEDDPRNPGRFLRAKLQVGGTRYTV
tara:strand:+ start:15 stop:1064 length:1050 start_codon:yes stop_codon:yes gene_type:complete